jgi:hypothetical protein
MIAKKISSFPIYRLPPIIEMGKIMMNLYSIPGGKMKKYHVPARQARTHGVKPVCLPPLELLGETPPLRSFPRN